MAAFAGKPLMWALPRSLGGWLHRAPRCCWHRCIEQPRGAPGVWTVHLKAEGPGPASGSQQTWARPGAREGSRDKGEAAVEHRCPLPPVPKCHLSDPLHPNHWEGLHKNTDSWVPPPGESDSVGKGQGL